MKAKLIAIGLLAAFACAKVPLEAAVARQRERAGLRAPALSLGEEIGQIGLAAAFGGFRSLLADFLFIQAHVAWERTDWPQVLLLFREVTALQPRSTLFWDMAAWHMGWNASTAALNDRTQPRKTLRVKRHREYLDIARDFLERGISHNPQKPQLYEALARLYSEKYRDHLRASEFYEKAAGKPGAPSYVERFSAYELSKVEGREREAYERLRELYDRGEQERLPTLIRRLKSLEERLNIPHSERIPDPEGAGSP